MQLRDMAAGISSTRQTLADANAKPNFATGLYAPECANTDSAVRVGGAVSAGYR